MTRLTQLVSGFTLLSVPTIIYGGYFLLTVISGQATNVQLTGFQQAMYRAGHAHAGVLVILSLVAQLYVDAASLSNTWKWVARISFPLSAILISGGFFGAAIGKGVNSPTSLIIILYVGIAVLVIGSLVLGIGLIRK